jgi:serine/threonine protein kinase
VGARFYIAPELEDGRVDEPEASSDVYSLGKVLYFILSGRHLMREDYAEIGYDLREISGPEMHFVYEVFDNSIKKLPRERLPNATVLLQHVDNVIWRLERNAHVLDISVPLHCIFCGVGEYERREAPTYELKVVCNWCGNVQNFTRQPPKEPWW